MLVVEDLLKNMKKHFPRWMDIRRKSKSTGSLLLESIAEESAEINKAIEDYKKDFFIDNYIGKEESILDFIYKANIGQVNNNKFVLISPDIDVVFDQNEFYNNEDVCLYMDGFIYFKNNYKKVEYAIDGYKSVATLEKTHVWNIYDEFAIFVGLRRFQWETNKELLNRILTKSNKTINSSENGLKEAIITNLINYAPELTKEDISIERPTADNLIKYYDEFESILDNLNEINRDTYRYKKWDVDTWNFKFKSVDYLPQAFDIVLPLYANGIGDNDDLKVSIIDNDTTTDAILEFYKKDEEAINSYIKNNNEMKVFKFELRKYNDALESENVKYRITASEADKIDPDKIKFNCLEEKTDIEEVLIEDVIDDRNLNNIIVEDKSILDPNFKYKIRFIPNKKIGEFRINECMQQDGTKNPVNLITEKSGFKFIDNNKKGVISSSTSFYAINKYQYSYLSNIDKNLNGFQISDLSSEGKMTLNINGLENSPIYFDYSVKEVPLLFNNIKRTNCYIKNNYIVADTVADAKFIEIDTKVNSLSLTIEGPFAIEYNYNNNGVKTISQPDNSSYKFELEKYDSPVDLKLKITLLDFTGKIKDIKYSKFDFKIKTRYGDESMLVNGQILPDIDINSVDVIMRAYTGFSPVLKYIYIGNLLSDSDFYGDIDFDPKNGTKLIAHFNDCNMQLTKIDKDDNIIEVIEDYKPYKFYSTKINDSIIKLDLSKYEDINSINVGENKIETYNYTLNNKIYYLKLKKNIKTFSLNVSGTIKKQIKTILLSDILKEKGYSKVDNDFYISKNIDRIIIENKKTKKCSFDFITRRDIFGNYNISSLKIILLNNQSIVTKFIERQNTKDYKTVIINNEINSYFDFLTFIPPQGNIYTAINSYNIISSEAENIEITNTFNKGYNPNKKMFYNVESLNEKYFVLFSNNSEWSLDENSIFIKIKDINNIKYNYETVIIEQELPLGTTIEIPETFMYNNEQIDINKYTIVNSNYNIKYKDKNNSLNPLDYLKKESFYINSTGFNKLKYSNLTEVTSINIEIKNNNEITSTALTENVDYTVKKDEGIIVWNNKDLLNEYAYATIQYYIKKPVSFELDINVLYDKVQYNVDSLMLINSVKLEKISKGQTIDLNIYESYKDSDIITIKCEEPGFNTTIKDSILTFNKNINKNTVAVREGYYYLDGNEYYLFSNNNYDNIENIDNAYFNNVEKTNKEFILKQQTTNFVSNSSMKLSSINNIFELNCKDKDIQGSSKLNAITACDSFNYWNSVASNLLITKGVNGQGIQFNSLNKINGYAYLSLVNFLSNDDDYVISFYLQNAKAYLGKERIIYSTNSIFNQQSVIDIIKEIPASEINDKIHELKFHYKTNNDENYYLIVEGSGLIDDIVVVPSSIYDIDIHTKNITHLCFDIEENIYAEYNTRLYLTDVNGSKLDGVEIRKDGTIFNSSYIDWGFTSIKSISSYNDFKKCTLTDIDLEQFNNKCIAKTGNDPGVILTSPIYIGNTKIIKNLLFKINNVMFNNMKGFKVKILTSDNMNNSFRVVSSHLDNIGCIDGENLSSYIKLMVEMPSNKVINNIELFVEYLSDENNSPSDMTVLSGTYISKVLDTGYNERFLVKNINISDYNSSMNNYIFQIRASKENSERTVWTDWKTIELKNGHSDSGKDGNIQNRIVFDNYRYYQFRLVIKGENSEIKANYIDLEVI